ncbi:MAG: di-trans,poly-cis-decaprenylcistransferase [Treponema sp.]|jgi:undecaprenyl diphosphate synthase|nr:di-trans,poly-cis-decaprenylcistransferase [Treponema sp.]
MGLHVGIIMDGNGRWAQSRGLVRTQGHREGLKAAKQIVKAASGMGIDFLTLYVFSTENWKRTADEVGFVMGLVRQYLKAEFAFCRENHIKVRHAGDISRLPPDIAEDIVDVCRDTETFTGMQVILALNYGGRDEIVRAVNKALVGIADTSGEAIEINETVITEHLDNPDIPDPDLIIRTAGEYRTSNFLLWESAYAEYYISDKLWPDWTETDLIEAVENFQKRERRFGAVNSAINGAGTPL